MPLCSAAIGSSSQSHDIDVSARRMIAYAAGLGETAPCYLDDAASEGIVAHPAFCVSLEWPPALELRNAAALGITQAEKMRGVHALQDSTFHRPIRQGDRLSTVARIVQIRAVRPGAFVLTKFATVDRRTSEPVVTSYSGGIYRGVGITGEDAEIETPSPVDSITEAADADTIISIPIARQAPHVYTECADIWNPIHTERTVALAAGLPDIILHGTATWALAASHIIQRCADGNPARLCRFVGRFTAMVIPGTTIQLHYHTIVHNGSTIVRFRVNNVDGEPAISNGMAIIMPASGRENGA